ncbi:MULTISPECIES: hypothetical protein [Streptomyces]|uniref:hypothetical protein n=1 Tax=Streptomyces TaxID=1883 RepID=UPI003697A561
MPRRAPDLRFERARRESRSKQELAIGAVRDAQDRAELKVEYWPSPLRSSAPAPAAGPTCTC